MSSAKPGSISKTGGATSAVGGVFGESSEGDQDAPRTIFDPEVLQRIQQTMGIKPDEEYQSRPAVIYGNVSPQRYAVSQNRQ
jgi:hypothetical protein